MATIEVFYTLILTHSISEWKQFILKFEYWYKRTIIWESIPVCIQHNTLCTLLFSNMILNVKLQWQWCPLMVTITTTLLSILSSRIKSCLCIIISAPLCVHNMLHMYVHVGWVLLYFHSLIDNIFHHSTLENIIQRVAVWSCNAATVRMYSIHGSFQVSRNGKTESTGQHFNDLLFSEYSKMTMRIELHHAPSFTRNSHKYVDWFSSLY